MGSPSKASNAEHASCSLNPLDVLSVRISAISHARASLFMIAVLVVPPCTKLVMTNAQLSQTIPPSVPTAMRLAMVLLTETACCSWPSFVPSDSRTRMLVISFSPPLTPVPGEPSIPLTLLPPIGTLLAFSTPLATCGRPSCPSPRPSPSVSGIANDHPTLICSINSLILTPPLNPFLHPHPPRSLNLPSLPPPRSVLWKNSTNE
jgi:hypothetical protein